MMKQYVERRNVTSQTAIVESRHNINSEDHGDPHSDMIKLDRVTSCNVPEEDPTCGEVTSMKTDPLLEHVPEIKDRGEATEPVRSVTPIRDNVKQDVKMTSDVIHRATHRGDEFHQVFDPTYQHLPNTFEARQIQYGKLLDFGIRSVARVIRDG